MTTVDVSETAHGVTVTLDGAERLNAMTGETFAALRETFEGFADDPPAVVTVRGAGGNFSAGVDLGGVPEWAEMSPLAVRDELEAVHAAIEAIESLDAPVLAACEGYVLGGGLELALACDVRIARADAEFGLPESKLGLAMDLGGAQKLPGIVSEGTTKYLVMTGESIGAHRAHEVGLVSEYLKADAFEDRLAELESSLASKPTYVHGLAKRQVHSVRPDLDTAMELAIHHAIAGYNEAETLRRVREFLDG